MTYGDGGPLPAPKVAIVGGATSRKLAPYDDLSWEIWAFSSLRLHTPRITRWFEMHALGDLRGQLKRDTRRRMSFRTYMAFLKGLKVPIYMQARIESLPTSVEYPLQEALDTFGRCFTSTASYLIALAILEGYRTIGVWGIHLTEKSVYIRQRPGVEYLLGVARQRGIEVYVPPQSPLRVPSRPRMTPTKVLYGYDWESPGAWWRRRARPTPRRRLRSDRRTRRPRRVRGKRR